MFEWQWDYIGMSDYIEQSRLPHQFKTSASSVQNNAKRKQSDEVTQVSLVLQPFYWWFDQKQ